MDKLLGVFKDRAAAANLLILNVCRNNPFEDDAVRSVAEGDTRGLAPIVSGFRGSLIAYSIGPGKAARDGEGGNSPNRLALSSALEGGVELLIEKSKDWFKRSAAPDYPSAFDKLGLMAANGEGQAADPVKAVALFDRGSELGDASAIVNPGTAYRKGDGHALDGTGKNFGP